MHQKAPKALKCFQLLLNKQHIKVEYNIPSLPAGNYTLKVTYNGDGNITSTTAQAKFEVAKADPVITVEVKDIVYGDVEYIVITSNAAGTVNVTVNGMTIEVPLNNGRAVLRASRWNVPNYNGCATVTVPDLFVVDPDDDPPSELPPDDPPEINLLPAQNAYNETSLT